MISLITLLITPLSGKAVVVRFLLYSDLGNKIWFIYSFQKFIVEYSKTLVFFPYSIIFTYTYIQLSELLRYNTT